MEIPEGVQVNVDGFVINVKGPKGEVKRSLASRKVSFDVKGNTVVFTSDRPTKREKKLLLTFVAHLRNMIKGVTQGHRYELKICSGHFPMSVASRNNQFIVKNFLGEKVSRVLDVKEGAEVKVEGDLVSIESVDIEKAGQVAADIEHLTRINNRDIRIFQDGIYIVKKPRDIA
ncbi:MAG: 50S ribosomal protein L6 [Candidatus Nanoarchaeia archaeon]